MVRHSKYTIHVADTSQKTAESLFTSEGQLAIDVIATKSGVAVIAPMAGVATDTIDIHIHNDVITIRGVRPVPNSLAENTDIYHQECYWGPFSRTVVLPMPVIAERAQAEYHNGILTIHIPKQAGNRTIPITIVED